MAVRIARFQNCCGPDGTWTGGREKAPAAICRKVAEVGEGGTIEVWGDGSAIRSYTYVDDMVDGIYRLMQSGLEGPVNIGSPEYVTVAQLVDVVTRVARKQVAQASVRAGTPMKRNPVSCPDVRLAPLPPLCRSQPRL
jgi:nucleoside-diphosphate-sugar epimerase